MQHFSKISLLALALVHFSTHSMYVNNGHMSSNDCNMNAAKLVNNGTIKGINSVNLGAKSLGGTGTIESPNITIACDEFEYSGVIACDKQCIIYVKKAFDAKMFKKSGKGVFKVVISPHDVERFNQEELSSVVYNFFYSKALHLDQNMIDGMIKDVRTQAALNFIDDKVVLEDIKKKLAAQVEKQEHDALSMIINRIDHALKTKRVPEEKIITLK